MSLIPLPVLSTLLPVPLTQALEVLVSVPQEALPQRVEPALLLPEVVRFELVQRRALFVAECSPGAGSLVLLRAGPGRLVGLVVPVELSSPEALQSVP